MILEPEPEWFITLMSSQTYLCSISFLVNTFHLMILSQKSMRISSTNVLMIGIAICDLYNMFQPVFKTIETAIESLDVCPVPNTYAEALFNWILYSICDDTKRCQCLLGIFLAFIRTLVIRKPKVENDLTAPKFGLKLTVSIFSFSSILSIWNTSLSQLKSDDFDVAYERCPEGMFPENFTIKYYYLSGSKLAGWNGAIVNKMYFLVDGIVSKITPPIRFPFFTFLLIREFRKFSEKRNQMVSNQSVAVSSRTTKLIIYMTIAFMVAQLPTGIFYVRQGLCNDLVCRFGHQTNRHTD
ncbi:hypothetical protein CAEBREN_03396 [Caenorhabditis brenneri]|uniref:G-protein coupled receptors family 1 profile domain-containing protein n=1 Tax=Caenorhabditis brenneri TaxID=135651 RepID=G0NIT9_CAEBE|nr:hypothetical protein CAEBREN_03396 [Caenorhabditis brenneri]